MKAKYTLLWLGLSLIASPALIHASDTSKINGSISAEAGRKIGDLDTVNGSIRIAANATTGSAETVNGSIEVGEGARTGDLETVNGGIRVGRNVQVDGGLENVNGSLFTDRGSRVRDDIDNVNGSIGLVGTHVGGKIETVNANVTIGVDSQVKGGLRVIKPKGKFNLSANREPRIIIGPNAVVEGPLVFERAVKLYVHSSARIGPVTGATAISFNTDTAPKD